MPNEKVRQVGALVASYGERMADDWGEWRLVELHKPGYKVLKEILREKAASGIDTSSNGGPVILTEAEWRFRIGLQMSDGWTHMGMGFTKNNDHVLLFGIPHESIKKAKAPAKKAPGPAGPGPAKPPDGHCAKRARRN
ncbi:unnamed protein product [Vitrella brassicaformis CCMP3155]|uniref:Cyclin-dependent kinases regulatory subunit n=2 Tax=Vitrella brassicaformis TaxID=1169539 RepID=A0A0G4ERC6_VITBC|nr:unnamed protein product [Vitrella brassicaformis CCMP3155]|eukprot:CEM00579.1 unnamed protein product [Vitrella brassicaformis CCMP3155]